MHELGPASIMWCRQIIHFGERQWNSFPRTTYNCDKLWATGSLLPIPNGQTISNWDWFLSANREFLYFRLDPITWHRFLRQPHTHRGYHEEFLEMQVPPIGDLSRATVCSRDGRIHLLSYVPRAAGQPPVDNKQHRVGNREIRKPQLPWTMSTLRTSPSIEGLLLALRNGTGCAVSDGSFYPNEKVGAAAWIIITSDGTECGEQSYYSSIQSRRRGERWAIRLIHRCWKIVHLIWMHRNAALHESEAHHNNRGATHLPLVITSEHSRGLDSLHRVYAPYFRIPLVDLLNRQISYQKQWFLLIRTARETVDHTFTVAFIGNPSFRRWIGLLPRH